MEKSKKTWICGKHAVTAAIENGKRAIHEIWLTEKYAGQLMSSFKASAQAPVSVRTKEEFDHKFEGRPHQGIAALVGPLPEMELDDIVNDTDLIVMLDQVTDPHNLGACLRSANAFGAGALVIPDRRAASLTDVAMKASSGASEHTPVIGVTNLNKAIQLLKDNDFWVVGLDAHTEMKIRDVRMAGSKTVIVMGSEGKGLRELVRKNCDFLAKLPMVGQVESLNVSVATGIALYEVLRQQESK